MLGHRCIEDPYPGVSAILINNPFSQHTVVVLWSMTDHGQSYAFGAGDSVAHAARRALVELSRTQSLLKQLSQTSTPLPGDLFERRIHYFSKEKGIACFLERLEQRVSSKVSRLSVVFDSAVVGPWDRYASVWRTIFKAPSCEYLNDREDFFFW